MKIKADAERLNEITVLYCDEHLTMQEIADKFGVTRQRIQQIIDGKKLAVKSEERICKQCGCTFTVTNRLRHLFCSYQCGYIWRYSRTKEARQVLPDQNCALCSKPFTPARSTQIYCSDKCRNKRRYIGQRDRMRAKGGIASLKSKYRGVQWVFIQQKWAAFLSGRYIGVFETEEEAHQAREEAINAR